MNLNFHPHFAYLRDSLKTIIGHEKKEYKFHAQVAGAEQEFSVETRSYELPKDQLLAFALLDFLDTFIKFTKDDFTNHVNYDHFAIDQKGLEKHFVVDKETNATRLPIPLHDYFQGQFIEKRDLFQAILQAVLTFRHIPDYQETMPLATILLRDPIDESGAPISKTLCLLNYVKKLIQDGRQIDLTKIIPILSEVTKRDLMAMGEGTEIRERDFMSSDARLFMENSTFCLEENGRIGIFGINKDPIYKARYAPGRMQEGFFEQDMRELARILKLDYDPESDFQKKIVFTEESSTRLKRMGLHLNLNYVKQLLLQKNRLRFFMSDVEDPAQLCLPQELRQHIAEQLDKAELAQTIATLGHLSAASTGDSEPAAERPPSSF